MNSTVKVNLGNGNEKSFEVSATNVTRFLEGMKLIAQKDGLAVCWECSSERRGVYASGMFLPT